MSTSFKPVYKILYVDDEPQNLMLFKATFRRYYDIHCAMGGSDALRVMKEHPFHIIISDQRMPGLTGSELLEKVKEQYPQTVRMIMTAYSDAQSMLDSINKGKIYHYITKPWDANELKSIIDRALESYDLKTANQLLAAEKKQLLLNSEKQKKENILAQFEVLKNQVNPHFLFNCLNTLYALLDEHVQAKEFVTKMSKVYRYLLTFRNESSVELGEELKFIDDYIFLQKIRFGESLEVTIDISDEYLDYFLPPLSMQILIENAIKHNVISKSRPLSIHIFVEEQYLTVRNNYQKRLEKTDSTGIGIRNIQDRYQFLSDQVPVFTINEDFYTAKIPLLD